MSFSFFSLDVMNEKMDMKILSIVTLVVIAAIFGAIYLHNKPQADFDYLAGTQGADICVGTRITFYNKSRGRNLSFHWDFGDGSTSSDENPDHVFQDAQDYSVLLTVVDSIGSSDSRLRTVRVEPARPIASFKVTPSNPITNDIVTFEDDSFHPGHSSIVRKTWIFDMAEPDICVSRSGSEFREEKVYSRSGTYRVMLTVEDDQGLSDSCIREVVVSDLSGAISMLVDTVGGLQKTIQDLNLPTRLDSLDRAVRDVLSARRFGWGSIGTIVGIIVAIGLGVWGVSLGYRRRQ